MVYYRNRIQQISDVAYDLLVAQVVRVARALQPDADSRFRV